MVEAEAPVQTEIEPPLCLGRTGGDLSRVTSEVEVSHASPLSPGAPQLTPEGWRTSPFDRFDGALDKERFG